MEKIDQQNDLQQDKHQDVDLNRLRWRARRGMLELDLLLLPFVDSHLASMSKEKQAVFIRLLEQDDPDLLQWFSGTATPDDQALAEMVAAVLSAKQGGL